jgi:urea carboxylase
MFKKVLIANRGAIAVRITRTLHEMGIKSVAVYAPSDRDSLHVEVADEIYPLASDRVQESYLDQNRLIEIAKEAGAEAIHPGYGFLSENAEFAERLSENDMTFIGPKPSHLRSFGLKHEARAIAEATGVNLLPGSGVLKDEGEAIKVAQEIGYPVMLKSSAGGGGIGMQCCNSPEELGAAFVSVQRLAVSNFGDASVFLEKYISTPRHVEVQVFGDGNGGVVAIGDRDCSLQRRNQKVIEECPAPNISDEVRDGMHKQAVDLLSAVNYENAGTVEFLYDGAEQQFYFLEVNTRLQVEHGVTEMVHGIDLVQAMVQQAACELDSVSSLTFNQHPSGHAVQARIYAEDPGNDFRPTPGDIAMVNLPQDDGLRVDTWIRSGVTVPPFYDPMLGKIIAQADSRTAAIEKLTAALDSSVIHGIETNLRYLSQALSCPDFRDAEMTTASLEELHYVPMSMEVLKGGAYTTIQSWPGRQGYWAVGVPPSGPMDDFSFRMGNRLLGNDVSAAGLEIVLKGPTIRFNSRATILIAAPGCIATLDGSRLDCYQPISVEPRQVLTIDSIVDGARGYLLVKGGLSIPTELGSSATFTLGTLGGFNGRTLQLGDVIHFDGGGAELPEIFTPEYEPLDTIRVLLGPHTAPDFFTDEDIETLLSVRWTVHYNSSRTGVRLSGPQPQWTRQDGGEAGLHPSNIHDNAYAFGSIDFTGDMPVILGPDGPSLGGFVCPGVVINADRWKLGQLRPGDEFTFVAVSEADAKSAVEEQTNCIETLRQSHLLTKAIAVESPILLGGIDPVSVDDVTVRRAGQEWLLVEFGPARLDIELHLKVHALSRLIEAENIQGIVEMTPGIRSLQIRFDMAYWSATSLTDLLRNLVPSISAEEQTSIASRIVRLPLSWDDPVCREAITRYTQGVRPNAPWCPSNIEFIRRINGLADTQAVKDIVFDASYLVMGLGDVYLGAPVATPLDPRHRLVTTKYNPARTWTAENSVGIGGSYMCIYGMEGPGGYQFVGRTLQVWNRYQRGEAFSEHWLLRGFDQIQFYEVSAEELLEMREAFPRGHMDLDITQTTFDINSYKKFLTDNQDSIESFTSTRQHAFDKELKHWRENDLLSFETPDQDYSDAEISESQDSVPSPMTGSVWSIRVQPDQAVEENDLLLVLEAMKSEFEVRAPAAGRVQLLVSEGQLVNAGQALAVVTP